MRTRHEEAPLIALQIEPFDFRKILNRRRGSGDDLSIPIVLGASDPQLDRVALRADARRIPVDLIEQNDSTRDATESAAAVRADEIERSADKLLLQNRVAAVL